MALCTRVANELTDPMGDHWCDCVDDDRRLLESLRDDVLEAARSLLSSVGGGQ